MADILGGGLYKAVEHGSGSVELVETAVPHATENVQLVVTLADAHPVIQPALVCALALTTNSVLSSRWSLEITHVDSVPSYTYPRVCDVKIKSNMISPSNVDGLIMTTTYRHVLQLGLVLIWHIVIQRSQLHHVAHGKIGAYGFAFHGDTMFILLKFQLQVFGSSSACQSWMRKSSEQQTKGAPGQRADDAILT